MIIRVATRGSQLSLEQARIVMDRIMEFNKDVEFKLVIVKTTGDVVQDKPLYEIGVKGIFEKEVNIAVLKGEADIAVHSLKDLPAQISSDLVLAMTPPRDDPTDSLVSLRGYDVWTLPKSARVGTSSLRRRGFLLRVRGDLDIEVARGNVDTRIRKLKQGNYDALVMATAGLVRIKADVPFVRISEDIMPPAPGQGIIGVVARRDRDDLLSILRRSSDEETFKEAMAERSFLARIGAGCHIPLGGLSRINGDSMDFIMGVVTPDGKYGYIGRITGSSRNPDNLGVMAAEELLRNAREVFAKLRYTKAD